MPSDLSRRLLHDLGIMSGFMTLGAARDALGMRLGGLGRTMEAADVKAVCVEKLGRSWGELRKEYGKIPEPRGEQSMSRDEEMDEDQ